MEKTVSFCGRLLTASELSLVRQIVADFPRLSQAELAYTVCELLQWRRPNGKLKSPECPEWLQRWQEHGRLPSLPQWQVTKPRGAHRLHTDPQSDPQPPLRGRLADFQPLHLQLIEEIEDLAGRRLFQQFIQRYHPLGYRVPYGAQLRYLVRAPSQDVLACLLFTSAAWKMARRDSWIGWSDADRPYTGTCYRAANWILGGTDPWPRPHESYPSGPGHLRRHSVVPAGVTLAPTRMPTPGPST